MKLLKFEVTDDRIGEVLTPDAIQFVHDLSFQFSSRIEQLLEMRNEVHRQIREGKRPKFLQETRGIREGDWQVSPYPVFLADRRVEITGPAERKMMINAFNSGANVYMADFEDSLTPTWRNLMYGQINLKDFVDGQLAYISPEGKRYEIGTDPAILFVRPRGLHLFEETFPGGKIPACLVDFGLFFFHNAKKLLDKGFAPCFYLPKLESYHEAKLWADIFDWAEKRIGLPHGVTKATVLIEHILASFQMEEILYELRDYSAGLNCGRWDYIFSYIKTFAHDPLFIVPDRSEVTMDKGFLKAYVDLLIKTCHRRGTFAMGGMAAQIPIKHDPEANRDALEKVKADKIREVTSGHDGTWVAHPGLVGPVKQIFDEYMPEPNQIHNLRNDVSVSADDLLRVPEGSITEQGVRLNINVALQYLMNWLNGTGCVAINYLMEDAATAEISRVQLWQWLHHNVELADGQRFTQELFKTFLQEERQKIEANMLIPPKYLEKAVQLLTDLVLSEELQEFLTIPAYQMIPRYGGEPKN